MTEDNSKLNMSEAARLVGVSRTTFYKDIKRKPISIQQDDDGNKFVYGDELVRAYNGKLKGKPPDISPEGSDEQGKHIDVSSEHRNGQEFTPSRQGEQGNTSEVVQVLRERIADLEGHIEGLNRDKEASGRRETELLDIIKRHTLLLAVPQQKATTPLSQEVIYYQDPASEPQNTDPQPSEAVSETDETDEPVEKESGKKKGFFGRIFGKGS